jgi:hypothetical protein
MVSPQPGVKLLPAPGLEQPGAAFAAASRRYDRPSPEYQRQPGAAPGGERRPWSPPGSAAMHPPPEQSALGGGARAAGSHKARAVRSQSPLETPLAASGGRAARGAATGMHSSLALTPAGMRWTPGERHGSRHGASSATVGDKRANGAVPAGDVLYTAGAGAEDGRGVASGAHGTAAATAPKADGGSGLGAAAGSRRASDGVQHAAGCGAGVVAVGGFGEAGPPAGEGRCARGGLPGGASGLSGGHGNSLWVAAGTGGAAAVGVAGGMGPLGATEAGDAHLPGGAASAADGARSAGAVLPRALAAGRGAPGAPREPALGAARGAGGAGGELSAAMRRSLDDISETLRQVCDACRCARPAPGLQAGGHAAG